MNDDTQINELYEQRKRARQFGLPHEPEDLCPDDPVLREKFRELLPHLEAVDEMFGSWEWEDQFPAVARVGLHQFQPMGLVGRGGQGAVFLATDTVLNRPVAVKVSRRTGDPATRRLVQEALITSRLQHSGIVPVYCMGADESGAPFYVMRFVQGVTLAEALEDYHTSRAKGDATTRHLQFRRLILTVKAVCETVAYAHTQGVIHRDIKPANIMLGDFGETLLVDWGLGKPLEEASSQSNSTDAPLPGGPLRSLQGDIKGSPGFMSPEQASGNVGQIGPASDVYGLGATLYAVLTGRSPHQGSTLREVLESAKQGQVISPREIDATISRELDAICRKALAHDPAQRYADPRELARDLERWEADEPVSAWREPFARRAGRWIRRHRASAIALMAGVLIALSGTGVLAIQRERERLSAPLAAARKFDAGRALVQSDPPRARVLMTEARDTFLWVRRQGDDSPAIRASLAEAQLGVAISALLSREHTSDAIATLRDASVLIEPLRRQHPEDDRYRDLAIRIERRLGIALARRARELLEQLPSASTPLSPQSATLAAESLKLSNEAEVLLKPLVDSGQIQGDDQTDYLLHLRTWAAVLDIHSLWLFRSGKFEECFSMTKEFLRVWEKRMLSQPEGDVLDAHRLRMRQALAGQKLVPELSARGTGRQQLREVLNDSIAALGSIPATLRAPDVTALLADLQAQLSRLESLP